MLAHRRRRADLAAALFLLACASAAPGCKGSRQAGVGGSGDGAVERGGDGSGNRDGAGGPEVTGGDGAAPGSDAGAGDARLAETGEAGGDATGGDTPGATDGEPGDAGFGAGCNTLVPGTPVTVVCAGDGGVTSIPAGGSIGAGTYVLTSITVFGPCIVLDVAQTLVVSGTSIQTAIQDSITGLSRGSATFTVSGAGVFSQLTQTNTCPDTMTRTFGYTATGNTLTLTSTDSGSTTVGVLTRQ